MRSVEGSSIFHRHEASPEKIIERPRPYRCTATTGQTAPVGADARASTSSETRELSSANTWRIIRREVRPQEHEALIGEAINEFSKLN